MEKLLKVKRVESYISSSALGILDAREDGFEPGLKIPQVLHHLLEKELEYAETHAAKRRKMMYHRTLPPAIGRVLRPGEVYSPRLGWFTGKFSARALSNEDERVKEILADATAHHAARQAYFEECMKMKGGFYKRYGEMDEINARYNTFEREHLKGTNNGQRLVDFIRKLEEKFPAEEMKKYPQLDAVTYGIMRALQVAETEHGMDSNEFKTTFKLAMEKHLVKNLSLWEASLVLESCAAHEEMISILIIIPTNTPSSMILEAANIMYNPDQVSEGYEVSDGTLSSFDVCELMTQRLLWTYCQLFSVRCHRDWLQDRACAPSVCGFIPKPPKPPVIQKSTPKPTPPLDGFIPSFHFRHQKRVPR